MRRRRNFWGCAHSSTITTITAGLAREVCEACARVRVSYVGHTVRLYPSIEDGYEDSLPASEVDVVEIDVHEPRSYEAVVIFEESSRFLTCGLCAQAAVFMIPDGLRCDEHAWQAAARLDWGAEDPWVPIRLDRSERPG